MSRRRVVSLQRVERFDVISVVDKEYRPSKIVVDLFLHEH